MTTENPYIFKKKIKNLLLISFIHWEQQQNTMSLNILYIVNIQVRINKLILKSMTCFFYSKSKKRKEDMPF